MKTLLIIAVLLISLIGTVNAQTQSDQSDAVWSIVMPSAACRNIDMKQCLLGTAKDSVVIDFMQNTGDWRFRVDSIYFRGADAGAFSLVSGFPKYILLKGENHAAEFHFVPNRVGIHTAEVVVITQADTLVRTIVGEGVQPLLWVEGNLLDFGEVEIGNDRVFKDTMLLKNIGGNAVSITNTVKMSPDIEQFEILSGGGAFTLNPNEVRRLTLQFKPKYGGRTSGRIGFEYNSVGSPAVVNLFGTGIGGLVSISSDSAYPGEMRTINIILEKVKPEGIKAIASRFSATLKFQKTILTPQDRSKITGFRNDSTLVKVEGELPNSNILISISLIAGLGTVEETTLEVSDFKLIDNMGVELEYDVDYRYGTFKLLGICREGGIRLINPTGKVQILSIMPNPASEDIEIKVNLIEDGATIVSIFNSNGMKIKEYNINGETGQKTINLNAKDFSNGLYFIQLQTPTVLENQKLMIIK
ncbi:MAG: T9SS type A sorting domain-containing protein [bacterium]